MKVVFLAVNCSYSHTSLAAWCLRTVVDESVWDWKTMEFTVKDDPAKVVSQVVAAKPDVIAATLYLFNCEFVAGLLSSLRVLLPGCRVVVGGPECLGPNEQLAGAGGLADVAVRGEGERALPELLERWREGRDWNDIPGLCGVDVLGQFHDHGSALVVDDFDSIPSFYERELVGFRKPFIQLETSRGCGNGCLFCTSRHTTRRLHSEARVRGDLQAIAAAGVKDVRIVDRTFNEDRARALMLIGMFKDEFPMLRFHLEIEPARFNQELAAAFAKARPGQFHLEAGIQSLNPTVCGTIERGATVNRTLEGLKRLCGLTNIEVHVDLIAGLPGGSLTDIISDLEGVMVFQPAEIQLERLKLLPGTPLANDPARWGLISNAVPPYQVLQTPSLSQDDLRRSDRLSKLIDWYYNTPELHASFVAATAIDPSFLTRFETWVSCSLKNASSSSKRLTGTVRPTEIQESPQGRANRPGEPELMGFDVRPSLETRFETLNEFLQVEISKDVSGGKGWQTVAHRLAYCWVRLGFSARNGLCPAELWKKKMPEGAILVEGDPCAKVARRWRVELDASHFFCYGTGSAGERAVVAVYRLPHREKAVDGGDNAV